MSSTGSHLAIPQVVKVFATTHAPDFGSPWRHQWVSSCTGSGVIIGPGEVLTGAHVVARSTFLQVQKMADPDKAVARVKAICHDRDLALLSVEDPRFVSGAMPVQVGDLVNLRDKVAVVGFPLGGEEISVTEGVVSRVEVQGYTHSDRDLLSATIDAAINPGNSGGPVFREGKIVGVAFQKIQGAEAMGAMVPAPLIQRFLEAVAQGRSAEVPGFGINWQTLENAVLRQRHGLGPEESGVRVSRVEYGGSCWGRIEPDDVLLEVDGLRIGNNGTVRYRHRFRTDMGVILGDHFVGDTIECHVLRRGDRQRVGVELKPLRRLVPFRQYDRPPTYFVYGGVVFQPLSLDYLSLWGERWFAEAPARLLSECFGGVRTAERLEAVVVGSLLADEINVGYENCRCEIVKDVNGRVPRDMADFVRLVEGSRERVEIRTTGDFLIVFDPQAVATQNPEILVRYHVDRDRSPDLAGLAER